MERIENINPNRITWACGDRGISIEQMAKEVGIAASTVNKLVAGEAGLTFNQLQRIAKYFERGVLFFLEAGEVDVDRVHTPQFRTLANMKPDLSPKVKAIIKRAERQRDLYLSLNEDLGIERVEFAPPNVANESIKETAAAIRAWLGITDQCSFQAYRELVEARGALVFRTNGYAGKWQIPKDNPILGFTIYDSSCPVIVVKKHRVEARQTFTLMHELGHLVLHGSSFIDDEDDVLADIGGEREANQFAGLVLVPDSLLDQINDAERPNSVSDYGAWLHEYRQASGVSNDVILLRLVDAGRLPQARYNEFKEWRDAQEYPESDFAPRLYRHREPKHIFGDTFVRTVLDARSAQQISLAKATRYLDGLKLKDFHRLEQSYESI